LILHNVLFIPLVPDFLRYSPLPTQSLKSKFLSVTEEYLAPVLAVRVVDGLDAAIDHINTHGSGHTDGIVTRRIDWAERFVQGVDSASVMVNASTRLSGGGDYGLGAVVGISTDRLHARGDGHLRQ